MKKLALLGLVAMLAFSACSFGDPFQDDPEITSMEGVLSEQVYGDTYAGTHLLTEKDGTGIPLNSLAINLSSSEYLENRVKVMAAEDSETGVFEVTGISVLERLNPDNKRHSFVSYKNTDMGFQMKYYDDWKMKSDENQVIFLAPEADETDDVDKIVISYETFEYTAVSTGSNAKKDPLIAYMNAKHSDVTGIDSLFREIGPDKLTAIEVSNAAGKTDYYLYRSGFIYHFSYLPFGVVNADNLNAFKQMLAEFQFTGFTVDGVEEDVGVDMDESIGASLPVVDMALAPFQSDSFKFQGKYPAKWYYAADASVTAGVVRHYVFSEEADGEELIGMDIMSGDKREGDALGISGFQMSKKTEGGKVYVDAFVEGRTYRFSGSSEYSDLMIVLASEIKVLTE
ncbi:MAG: hypothetical protein WC873_03555 [Candidatus Gracilibacteria bacterium]